MGRYTVVCGGAENHVNCRQLYFTGHWVVCGEAVDLSGEALWYGVKLKSKVGKGTVVCGVAGY